MSENNQSENPTVSFLQSVACCQKVVAAYDRAFYSGSWLMPQPKRWAMWSVYAWFRQKDERIDGPEPLETKKKLLNQWFEQLDRLFSSGQPAVATDVALVNAIEHYDLTIEPFQDMLKGQQMALDINRYPTWEDLQLYCYRVAGTVGLVSASILGVSADCAMREALITFGIAMQMTNILQDVGIDARQGRVYLPLEDLKRCQYAVKDIFKSVLNQQWRVLMSYEIQRARALYSQVEEGLEKLPKDVLWPMWTAWLLYQQDLIVIERNGYRVFGDRPVVPLLWKVNALITAWWRSQSFKPIFAK
ncbi:MAG: squalene/phytoene synthase family protein [Cyanobacteria bacterium P01_D01_bin.36]